MDWFSDVKIDQELLITVGASLQRLKMYPYFDLAHYILTISSLREELGPGFSTFSRRCPLNCWVWSIVACFAGSFLTNFLLSEPLVAVFKKPEDLFLATIVWYLVWYAPFDLFWKISHFLPFNLILCIMKECQRAHKINHGVTYATRLYPNAYLIHALVGVTKGAGTGFVRIFDELVVGGIWASSAKGSEFSQLSFTTKAVMLTSVLLTVDKGGHIVGYCPHEIVYLSVVLFFVYFKLCNKLLDVKDPLLPFENLFCAIFMGGIWDALARAVETSRERRTGDHPVEQNGHQLSSEHKKQN